ncbi:MAG: fibronectin type III domain-containing protein [bacterium]
MKCKVFIVVLLLSLVFAKLAFGIQPLDELQPIIPPNNATNQSINTNLVWSGTGGTVTYEVYFGTRSFTLNKIGTTTLTIYDKLHQLAYDTWYIWKIIATNGTFTEGGTWTFKTIDDKPPGTPTGLIANAIWWNEIKLSWNDTYDDEYDFTIQRKTGVDGVYSTITTVVANTTSYYDKNLSENTTYYYRIAGRDGYGYSNYSEPTSATTPLRPQFNPYDNLFDPTKGQQVTFRYILSWAAK